MKIYMRLLNQLNKLYSSQDIKKRIFLLKISYLPASKRQCLNFNRNIFLNLFELVIAYFRTKCFDLINN